MGTVSISLRPGPQAAWEHQGSSVHNSLKIVTMEKNLKSMTFSLVSCYSESFTLIAYFIHNS